MHHRKQGAEQPHHQISRVNIKDDALKLNSLEGPTHKMMPRSFEIISFR